jgi:hypothetical protein
MCPFGIGQLSLISAVMTKFGIISSIAGMEAGDGKVDRWKMLWGALKYLLLGRIFSFTIDLLSHDSVVSTKAIKLCFPEALIQCLLPCTSDTSRLRSKPTHEPNNSLGQ